LQHLFYVLYDAVMEWSLDSWLWWALGLSLLVVHKNDFISQM